MNEVVLRRQLLEQANDMVRTTDPAASMNALVGLVDTLGSLLSAWTGETVRVQITAEGQPEGVDMVKPAAAQGAGG